MSSERVTDARRSLLLLRLLVDSVGKAFTVAIYEMEKAGYLCEVCNTVLAPALTSALELLYAGLLYAQQRKSAVPDFPHAETVFGILENRCERLRACVFGSERIVPAFLAPTSERNQ